MPFFSRSFFKLIDMQFESKITPVLSSTASHDSLSFSKDMGNVKISAIIYYVIDNSLFDWSKTVHHA